MSKRSNIFVGLATSILLTVVSLAPFTLMVKLILSGVLSLVAVSFYSLAIAHWVADFKYEPSKKRRSVHRYERYLQWTVPGLFILSFILVFTFIAYNKLGVQAPLDEQQALIERYRNLFKISEVSNKTTLIELTNKELKAKGTLLYKKIKAMNSFYGGNIRKLQTQLNTKQIDKEKFAELSREQVQKGAEEFDKESRVDAQMVLVELRNRIPYGKRKHIIGLPNINPADPRDGSVSLYSTMTGEFGFWWSELLAREIEELVKLLPDN